MKPRTLTWVPTLTLLTVLAIPVRLAAQDNQEHNKKHKHHHYQVIDIGTFGGPQSFFNSLSLTDRFGFGTTFYGFARVRNNQGSRGLCSNSHLRKLAGGRRELQDQR